jgi:hypothetical protein
MNGAGEKIGPVALEERLLVKTQASNRTRLADERASLESHMYLLRAVLGPFGHETDVFEHANACFGRAIAI